MKDRSSFELRGAYFLDHGELGHEARVRHKIFTLFFATLLLRPAELRAAHLPLVCAPDPIYIPAPCILPDFALLGILRKFCPFFKDGRHFTTSICSAFFLLF